MEKYEIPGVINSETGMLAVKQNPDLASRLYDTLTSEKAKRVAMYALPIGLATLVSGCANVDIGGTIGNIITGGSGS